ncbi:MAG: hypothetical protein ACLQNE_00990 [Thermoguttaceae bacterium]
MADAYETGRRDRAHLLKFNVEKIEQGYLQAVQAGTERPVMLVIDLRDKMGFDLASRINSFSPLRFRFQHPVRSPTT